MILVGRGDQPGRSRHPRRTWNTRTRLMRVACDRPVRTGTGPLGVHPSHVAIIPIVLGGVPLFHCFLAAPASARLYMFHVVMSFWVCAQELGPPGHRGHLERRQLESGANDSQAGVAWGPGSAGRDSCRNGTAGSGAAPVESASLAERTRKRPLQYSRAPAVSDHVPLERRARVGGNL